MQNLHSSIQNIISREIVGNTNPHIGEGVNQYNNHKKTFTLKHYFDNIYVSPKNEQTISIQYLPRNGFSYTNTFAECDVDQFKDFINILQDSERIPKNNSAASRIFPSSITKGENIYDISNIKFEFANSPVEYQKTIRQNILKHVNISVYRYAEPETLQPFQTEQGQFPSLVQPNIDTNFSESTSAFYENEKINEFYKYCSENFVQEKTFDEVVNLLLSSEEERQKLVAQLAYYRTFDGYKGEWVPIGNLSQDFTIRIEDGTNTYIPCAFMMPNNDMRNNSWTTKNMKIIDSLFFIKIPNNNSLEKLKSFVRPAQLLATTQRAFSFQGS
jgi:hypothetical protein